MIASTYVDILADYLYARQGSLHIRMDREISTIIGRKCYAKN